MNFTRKKARELIYRRHIGRLTRLFQKMETANHRFFWARLTALIAGGAGTYLAFSLGSDAVGWAALLVAVGVFAFIVFQHRKLDQNFVRVKFTLDLAENQAARMNLDWANIPIPPAGPVNSYEDETQHPFATDLNLVGKHSLHHLIDTAISAGGSQRLRNWLINTHPSLEQVANRHALLAEIQALTGFRNRLSLNGAIVLKSAHARWDGEKLVDWLEHRQAAKSLEPSLILLGAIAFTNILLLLLNLLSVLPPLWALSLVIYVAVYGFVYQGVRDVFGESTYLGEALASCSAMLSFLEKYPYGKSTRLASLCRPFWEAGERPSRYLKSTARIASAASLQRNFVVWIVLNGLGPWDLFFAHQLNQTKKKLAALLPQWLDTWYELDALNSIANFAYLNPDFALPQVRQPSGGDGKLGELCGPRKNDSTFVSKKAIFTARDLGHPLIPDAVRIVNDFCIENLGEVILVSGSNMSGKSTFLRTVGINLCLAFCGAPVCASGMDTILFRIFTSINLSDSINDGISYFYAEVRRLKKLLLALEAGHEYPVFYLIDEIFRGTNNKERRIGSSAYVKTLAGAHGSGLISTHDLELVHLSEEFAGIKNYHFREEVHGDRMVFDYRLRTGPCPTTNALKIMQIEGLPVHL